MQDDDEIQNYWWSKTHRSRKRCSEVWDSFPLHRRSQEKVSHDFASVTECHAHKFDEDSFPMW